MNRPTVLIIAALMAALLLAVGVGWQHFVQKPSVTDVLAGMERQATTSRPEAESAAQPDESRKTPPSEAQAKKMIKPAASTTARQPRADQRKAGQQQPEQQQTGQQGITPPTFDVVRVSSDGMAVLAGRAAPRARVEILLDGKSIATVEADENGEWAFAPGKPIFTASHQLTLRAGFTAQTSLSSPQTLTVSMQPAGKGGTPLVLLASPDAPTRVLQKPAPRLAQAPKRRQGAEQRDAVRQGPARQDIEQRLARAAGKEQLHASLQSAMEDAGQAHAAPAGQKSADEKAGSKAELRQPSVPLALSTVDYDSDGAIFFTGRGKEHATFRLYVDNQHLGDVRADEAGNWQWRGRADIKPGRHLLRIDRIDANGKVQERIELPFVRAEPQVVLQARLANAAGTADAGQASSGEEQQQPSQAQADKPQSEDQATQRQKKATLLQTLRQAAAKEDNPPETVAHAGDSSDGEQKAQLQKQQERVGAEAGKNVASQQEEPSSANGVIIVQPGNNLWNIARVIYGKGVRYTAIYEANRDQIRNPHLIYPGQVFTAPGVPKKELRVDPHRSRPATEEELRKMDVLR